MDNNNSENALRVVAAGRKSTVGLGWWRAQARFVFLRLERLLQPARSRMRFMRDDKMADPFKVGRLPRVSENSPRALLHVLSTKVFKPAISAVGIVIAVGELVAPTPGVTKGRPMNEFPNASNVVTALHAPVVAERAIGRALSRQSQGLIALVALVIVGASGCAVESADDDPRQLANTEQALTRGGGSHVGYSCDGGICTCDKSIENDCENMSGVCTSASIDGLIQCINGWLTTGCTCPMMKAQPRPGLPKVPVARDLAAAQRL